MASLEKKKLSKEDFVSTRDLIPTAIYLVLMVVVMLVIQMVASISPWIYVFAPIITGVITTPIFMLWMLKVQKIGTCTIHAAIVGIVYFIAGGSWVCPVVWLPMGIIMDAVRYVLKGKDRASCTITYGIYLLTGVIATYLPVFILGDALLSIFKEMMEAEFYAALVPLFSVELFTILAVVSFVVGAVLGLIGYNVFKKKFVRAGLVDED